MEISIIFIPCIMVIKSRKLQKETLEQILEWERNPGSGTSVDTGSTYVQTCDDLQKPSPAPSTGPIRSELYSMKALEKALTTNIGPLLLFSATQDFSAENISFLKHIQDWRANWTTASTREPQAFRFHFPRKSNNLHPLLEPEALRRQQFAFAVEIYVSFVSPLYSDFPINISGPQSKILESVFSDAASTLDALTQENTATPFDSYPCAHPRDADDVEQHIGGAPVSPVRSRDKDAVSVASTAVFTPSATTDNPFNTYNDSSDIIRPPPFPSFSLLGLKPRLGSGVAVPSSFGPHVFDEAERAVKYVVLTNTWPRFVAAGSANKGSREKKKARFWEKRNGDEKQRVGGGWAKLWGGTSA